jgi:pimeloyl-ACP methyl ester carboxylesterase
MFDAIAFAGGGNRCYWQGGFFEAAAGKLGLKPKLIVGVSAGAFAACYSLLGIGPRVRALVIAGCGPQVKNFDPAGWRKGGPLFPVGKLYRELIAEVLDAPALVRLQALTELQIALSRMPPFVPPLLGAALGISAYQIEKKLLHPVHPRFGRALGFRQEYAAVRSMRTPAELVDVLLASSGVPPLMPVTKVGGSPAFDGGLVDNVPVAPLEPVEQAGGRTLVLLTRRYLDIPQVPGRTYVQPSEPIRVGQFDVTNPEGIRAAYELGLHDGAVFATSIR